MIEISSEKQNLELKAIINEVVGRLKFERELSEFESNQKNEFFVSNMIGVGWCRHNFLWFIYERPHTT